MAEDYPSDEATERAESLLSSIRDRQFATDEVQAIDCVNTDGRDPFFYLKMLARKREVNVDDAITIQGRLDAERQVIIRAEMDREELCFSQADEMTLFKVHNTAGRKIDVIAASVDCAKFFAHRVGHVHDEVNATVFRYTDAYIEDLRGKKPAIWQAIRAGIPGVVKSVGNHAIVKGKTELVYSPISLLSVDSG